MSKMFLRNWKLVCVFGMAVMLLCSCGKVKAEQTESQQVKTAESLEATEMQAEIITRDPEPVQVVAETAKTVKAEAEVPTVDLNSQITGYMYCLGSNVNVRASASTEAGSLGLLQPNDKVGLLGVSGDWVNIVYQNQSAYVSAQYLTEDADWKAKQVTSGGYGDGSAVSLNPAWKYADYSKINSGNAVMYTAKSNRRNIVVGVNAGHGTQGGSSVKTQCHPDGTPKVTGGSTAAGATSATAVSGGMNFNDGTGESSVTLKEARLVRDMLLAKGYDVLMLRDGDDVQLDNIARTVICNNAANCHIAIHFDGDGLGYDKGCFFMSVPDGIKNMEPVASTWQSSEAFGAALIKGLADNGCKIFGDGTMDMDLTQTSYSSVPSIDIELGNQCTDHSEAYLTKLAQGIAAGVDSYFAGR